MSTLGLIFDSNTKFDKLLSDMFTADANQSLLYQGTVSSIAEMIERGGSSKDRIEEVLRQGFYDYFNRYYENVGVEITINDVDNSTSQLDFYLNITLSEGQSQSQYGMLIKTVHRQLQEIIRANNYG